MTNQNQSNASTNVYTTCAVSGYDEFITAVTEWALTNCSGCSSTTSASCTTDTC